jgi:Ca2+-binding RTX toxin-like protein
MLGNRLPGLHNPDVQPAGAFAYEPDVPTFDFVWLSQAAAPPADPSAAPAGNEAPFIPWPAIDVSQGSDLGAGDFSPTVASPSGQSAQAASGGTQMSMCGCAACAGNSDTKPQAIESAAADSEAAAAGPQLFPNVPTNYVGALLNEYDLRWGGSAAVGSAVTITYSFLTSVPGYYPSNADEHDHFASMNALQNAAVRDILQTYSDVANINFVEVTGVGAMTFGVADLGAGIAGWAYYPSTYQGGDVWITNRYPEYANPTKGTWEYTAFIHEIGHAIGLKHPGDYNAGGGGTGGPYLPTGTDSHQYTVMSYYSGPSYIGEPITPQLYDVAAVQYLYGANSATRAGNDTYITSAAIKTIWDGGGVDAIDGSGYGGSQIIDLTAGNFSSVNGGSNNLAIAYNVTIENAYGSGGNDKLTGNAAANILDGGVGVDTMIGGAGNDTYYVDNAGDVIVELADQGTDLLYTKFNTTLADNFENLTLLTGAGAINGSGNAVANVIVGNESANVLTGKGGPDRLTGNAGADMFVFADGETGASFAARDVITDFTIGQDVLHLIGIDANAGTAAADLFYFIGSTSFSGFAGELHYRYEAVRNTTVLEGDTNGDLLADFALDLIGNIALATGSFVANSFLAAVLTGTADADQLVGQKLPETLIGLEGDDSLSGGGGPDTLVGGDGNDTYVVTNTGVTISEISGEGSEDRVLASINYTLGADIENLTLSGSGAINGTGNELANAIAGNKAGNVLSGLGGDDRLDGGGGTDRLIGGEGSDTYVINGSGVTITELAGQGDADTVLSAISFTLAAEVENLVLTGAGVINGTGNAFDNIISGNNAANTLNGGAGDDTLDGGLGNDLLIGGAGADDLTGGGGTDTASYASDTIGVTVSLEIGMGHGGQAEGDTLANIANLTGGSGSDSLEGDGGNNVLNGGSNLDTLSYEHAAAAVTVSLATTAAQNTGGAGTDTVRSFENLVGSAGDDELIGTSGANVLSGLDGDDRINGGAGSDRMIGGGGSDTYYVDSTGDVVIEAAGQGLADTVLSSITHTLAAEVENLTLTGTAARNGTGNVLNNVIVGNSAANTLSGGLGDDTLNGGLGNDVLNGGAGSDSLTGGGGNDVFKFLDFFGQDTVTDFTRGQDDIHISKSIFSSWADLFAQTADDGFGNTIISFDADHTIVLLDVLKSSLQSSDFSLV